MPAARIARKLDKDFFVGIEYYGDYGKIGNFAPPSQQQQLLFAVTDFKLGAFDVDFGLGFGLTAGSDKMIAKTIISYAFPAPDANSDTDSSQGGALMMPRSMLRARRDNQFTAASMLMQ